MFTQIAGRMPTSSNGNITSQLLSSGPAVTLQVERAEHAINLAHHLKEPLTAATNSLYAVRIILEAVNGGRSKNADAGRLLHLLEAAEQQLERAAATIKLLPSISSLGCVDCPISEGGAS